MARSDTEHFDTSKLPRRTEHFTAERRAPPPGPDDGRRERDEPPRRRRPRGVGALRQNRLPEVGRLLIMAAWMRDSQAPEPERAIAFRSRLRREIDQLRDRLSVTDSGGKMVRYALISSRAPSTTQH